MEASTRGARGPQILRSLRGASLALLVMHVGGGCGASRMVGAVDVPGSARVLSMAVAVDTVFLGMAENPTGELHVIDAGTPGAPVLVESIEVGASVRGVAARDGRLFLATSDPTRELRVLDAVTRVELGAFDLPGERSAEALAVVEYTGTTMVVVLVANDPLGPEQFAVDASDPSAMRILTATEGDPPIQPPTTMGGYEAGGSIVARGRGAADPALTLLAVDRADAEFQIVADLDDRLTIADVNGDGTIRLACLGDSNTFETAGRLSWCTLSRGEIWHHALEHDSRYARLGARMVPPSGVGMRGAAAQLASAIADGADQVILAFGTNDVATPVDVFVAKAVELESRAAAAGIGLWVALVPPRGPNAGTGEIEAMNAALRAAFDPSDLVDFYTGFSSDDMIEDGLHFTPAGQVKRGHVVRQRLVDG